MGHLYRSNLLYVSPHEQSQAYRKYRNGCLKTIRHMPYWVVVQLRSILIVSRNYFRENEIHRIVANVTEGERGEGGGGGEIMLTEFASPRSLR